MTRRKHWAFLWLEYDRTGYVEKYTLFGFTLYRRSGSVIEFLGKEWIQK